MKNYYFIGGSMITVLGIVGFFTFEYVRQSASNQRAQADVLVAAASNIGGGDAFGAPSAATSTASSTSKVLVVPTRTKTIPSTAAMIAKPAPPPAGYVLYKNSKFSFSFYHSPGSALKEYDEGGGAVTVTLQNEQSVRGLQIFIVPYKEKTISEARFHRDVPSGVRTDIKNTTVDSIPAVTFHSTDQFLGDTREVWFIHGGYLYEVTTFKGLGDWFAPIMATWNFL